MNDTTYNTSGSWMALSGIAVIFLAKIGVNTDAQTVGAVIGGILAVAGIVNQWLAHRKLAVSVGALK